MFFRTKQRATFGPRGDEGQGVETSLGLHVAPVTQDQARRLGLPSADGVMITSVDRGSVADDANLDQGWVITRIASGVSGSTSIAWMISAARRRHSNRECTWRLWSCARIRVPTRTRTRSFRSRSRNKGKNYGARSDFTTRLTPFCFCALRLRWGR